MPDVVIIGAQRGGTTSLLDWLRSQPDVAADRRREIHYFADRYDRGPRWYRAQHPIARSGRLVVESSPYLLFHPLAPGRVRDGLPDSTRFVALLRDPVQRAVSHYWHERRLKLEPNPLDVALDKEPERLARHEADLLAGGTSFAHQHYAYQARGVYAPQLERWFDAVGRDRVLVVESERMFGDPAASAAILAWIGLPPSARPFPALNEARRNEPETDAVVARLEAHFAEPNERLFELLGRRLWGR